MVTGFSFDTIKAWVEAHERFKVQALALADGAKGSLLVERLAPLSGQLAAIAPILAELKRLVDKQVVIAGQGTIAAPGLDGVAKAMRLLESLAIAEGLASGTRQVGANQTLEPISQAAHLELAPSNQTWADRWNDFVAFFNGLTIDQQIGVAGIILTTLYFCIQLNRDIAKDRIQPADQRAQAEVNAAAMGKVLRALAPDTMIVQKPTLARSGKRPNSSRVAMLKANQVVSLDVMEGEWAQVSWRTAEGTFAGWVPRRVLKRLKPGQDVNEAN